MSALHSPRVGASSVRPQRLRPSPNEHTRGDVSPPADVPVGPLSRRDVSEFRHARHDAIGSPAMPGVTTAAGTDGRVDGRGLLPYAYTSHAGSPECCQRCRRVSNVRCIAHALKDLANAAAQARRSRSGARRLLCTGRQHPHRQDLCCSRRRPPGSLAADPRRERGSPSWRAAAWVTRVANAVE